MPKLKNVAELKSIVENLKKQNRKIITTNGIFDILHVGHVRYLNEAKKLGSILIVAINSDISTKQIKGRRRPLSNENERAEVLAALECVDYVSVFNEKNPIKFLGEIKPDIHVKGGDYNINEIIEKDSVEKNGGKVMLIPKINGHSTTSLIKKIAGLYSKSVPNHGK